MASSRSRISLAAAALAALALGLLAILLLRPGPRPTRGEPAAGDEGPAGPPAERPSSGPATLAAGGRAPRPVEAVSSPPTPEKPDAGAIPAASAPSPPPAPPLAERAGPIPPERAADGVAGVVFDAKGPVAGAVLRLRRGTWGARKYDSKPPAEPELTIPVDAEGRFLRSGLETGEWWAEVVVPGLLPRVVGFRVGEAGAGTSVEIGDGGVEGRLYDREGRAMVDAAVTIDRGPIEKSPLGVFLETRTSADGAFRFDGLVAGPWWLVGFTGPDRYRGDNRTERIVVVAGMTITHDLGIPRAEPRWRGRVLTRSGAPVRGGGAAALLLIEKAVSRGHAAKIDDEGRFSERFPAGLHSVAVVYLGGVEHKPIEAGEVALDGDLEKDLTLPGSRLSGTIRSASAGSLPRDQRLYWMPDGKDSHSREAVSVAADGSYVVDGMPPGRYRITGFPLALLDARGDVPVVDMAADPAEVTLDLVARPP